MKINFVTDFDNVKPFLVSLYHTIENITLEKGDNENINNILSDIYYIVLDTTGIMLVTKSLSNDKYIVEANNIRALECGLYLASYTHELDDSLIESGDESYKEVYRQEISDTLEDLGLDHLYFDDDWYGNKNTMLVDFSLDQTKIDYCMYKVKDYIDNKLEWGDEVQIN